MRNPIFFKAVVNSCAHWALYRMDYKCAVNDFFGLFQFKMVLP